MTTTARHRMIGAALCVSGGALVLLAAGRPWGHSVVRQPAPAPGNPSAFLELRREVRGSDAYPAAPALGLVALAGAGAAVATRARARRATGLVLAAAGVTTVVGTLQALLDPTGALRMSGASPGAWGWASVVGGVMVGVAGAVVTVSPPDGGGLDARHEPPGHSAADASTDDLWERIERGDSPA